MRIIYWGSEKVANKRPSERYNEFTFKTYSATWVVIDVTDLLKAIRGGNRK